MLQEVVKNGLRFRIGALCVLSALLLGMPGGVRAEHKAVRSPHDGDTHSISQLVAHIDTMEVAVQVTQFDSKELEKIGRDFGTTYRFRHLTLQYKQPGKIRLEARSALLGGAVMILNGPSRYFSVPKLHIKNTENLENAPGKRLSLLEYMGVMTPEPLRYMDAHFVKEETLDGNLTAVYDMTYTNMEHRSSYRIWLDPKTHITVKREWYDSEKKLRATFTYQDPQEVTAGVWLPTHMEVKNADGILAATTSCSEFKVNQGLDNSLFTAEP